MSHTQEEQESGGQSPTGAGGRGVLRRFQWRMYSKMWAIHCCCLGSQCKMIPPPPLPVSLQVSHPLKHKPAERGAQAWQKRRVCAHQRCLEQGLWEERDLGIITREPPRWNDDKKKSVQASARREAIRTCDYAAALQYSECREHTAHNNTLKI